MTWLANAPQGHESDKVKLDVLRYCATGGLDVGCGPSKVWPHFVGVDSCKDTDLFGIQMKPDIVVSDATRLGLFADESMNCVFSSHTLEHIEAHVSALREWWRLVKVGGHLVLYLPHKKSGPAAKLETKWKDGIYLGVNPRSGESIIGDGAVV